VKVEEARVGVGDGADEVDMVMNVGAFLDGERDLVRTEIERVVEVVGPDKIVKVIIETCVLSDVLKREASLLLKKAGAQFVKTSTGFGSGGATVEDVGLLRGTVGDSMGVKASGGIRTFEQAVAMVDVGATRIGTSASVQIIRGLSDD
jgi:deoxyribose-phosphate aldolase